MPYENEHEDVVENDGASLLESDGEAVGDDDATEPLPVTSRATLDDMRASSYVVQLVPATLFEKHALADLQPGLFEVYGIVGGKATIEGYLFECWLWSADQVNAWLAEHDLESVVVQAPTLMSTTAQSYGSRVECEMSFDEGDSDTYYHLVIPENNVIRHPVRDFPATSTFLRGLQTSWEKYSSGGYEGPILNQHNTDGDRFGVILEQVYRSDGPKGAGYYVRLQWHGDALAKIRDGKQEYLSPGLLFNYTDYRGDEYPVLMYEVSLATIPHIQDLPKISEGVIELKAFLRDVQAPDEEEVRTMPENEEAKVEAKVETPAESPDVVQLRAKNEELAMKVAALERREAERVVMEHVKSRVWSTKDDVEGKKLTFLVEFRRTNPEQYDNVVQCVSLQSDESVRLSSGKDVQADGEKRAASTDRVEFLNARTKRADAIFTEAKKNGGSVSRAEALVMAVAEEG